ncbi:MAG: tetratricopeptide repeat protein [Thermodesulfobacteriota bacterium]|nr:tetratricopeptide repeat protein [Thermodesulfobacteriota bacterium]
MGLRICLNKKIARGGRGLLLVAGLISLCACAGIPKAPESPAETALPAPEMVGPPGQSDHAADARMAAAHNLVKTGYQLLQQQQYDEAIRVFERAVGINPGDGSAYYYLAEAWLAKGDADRAHRFNELAMLYLRDDSDWARRAVSQQRRIEQKRKKNRIRRDASLNLSQRSFSGNNGPDDFQNGNGDEKEAGGIGILYPAVIMPVCPHGVAIGKIVNDVGNNHI